MTTSTSSTSFIRRRRLLIFLTCLVIGFLFIGVPWEVPSSLKGAEGLSRANAAHLANQTQSTANIDEIYGLLRIVTGDAEYAHVLANAVELNPESPISFEVYAAGQKSLNWQKEVERINEEHPIIVFSKTYCPYSKKAKDLLGKYDIQPLPKIIEVDLRDDSLTIKALLTRLTGHSTFPNVIVRGKSIGGSDNLMALHNDQGLVKAFEISGAIVKAVD